MYLPENAILDPNGLIQRRDELGEDGFEGLVLNAGAPAAEFAKSTALAAGFKADSCCDKANKEKKLCDHACCKEALAANKVCEKCNPK